MAPAEKDELVLAKLKQVILNSSVLEVDSTPFIGHLCHVLLIDAEGRNVAFISVVYDDSRCLIRPGANDHDRVVTSLGRPYTAFRSQTFVRYVYSHLKKHAPGFLEQESRIFQMLGETLERRLFGPSLGEQGVESNR